MYRDLITFGAGLLIGSLLYIWICWKPKEQSIVQFVCNCPKCGNRSGWHNLWPVISRFLFGGKCKTCGAPSSSRKPAVELITAILLSLLSVRFGWRGLFPAYSILICALIVVSYVDYDYQIIPSGPLFFVAGAGILYAFIDKGWEGLLASLLGAACGAVPLLVMDLGARVLYKKEGIGMGDVKLMAAAGMVMGAKLTLFSLLLGVWICALWICVRLIGKKMERGSYIPFGPFLASGCVLSIFFGSDVIAWYLNQLV